LLPSFIHSLIPFFNHFLALTPTANRKGRQQCAHAPHPRPLSPSFLRGEGGQSVKRSWPPTLDCDDLSSLWISNAASLVTRLHPNRLHPPLGGSAASPGELPGRGYSRDAFKSDAPISEPTLPAGSLPSPATLPRRVELVALGHRRIDRNGNTKTSFRYAPSLLASFIPFFIHFLALTPTCTPGT
jgi:hypothetical protein